MVADSSSDLDSHSQEIQTLNLVSCCETVQIKERESQWDCFKLEGGMFAKRKSSLAQSALLQKYGAGC